jgi:cation diffusion facilitator CzcD-associated flavoprotein CzcO
MEHIYDLCIIGFGISGISLARWAEHSSLKYIILEKNPTFGGCWLTNSYNIAKLQTAKHNYNFCDFPMDSRYGMYPNKTKLLQYFNEYIVNKKIKNINYKCKVIKISNLSKNEN